MLIRCCHKSTSNQHRISIFKFKLNYVNSIFNYDIVNISNRYQIDVALEPQVSVKENFKINSILPLQHWKTRYMILKLANLLIQLRKRDSKVKKTGGRKSRTKTVCASDSISSTESSEDVLDLYKRTNNDIEKIRASGHTLTSK
ncbi:hypothetical protein RclHR1_06230001 [Rhizophagus clarus]|uniref:Uncharacterized protein n=1 Tax=Rhizophagus clarus TaxID=94130 RepID=A0A2Z6RT29_9GLOM|nr:hypothetical protein RclHR1_06230001 [Rhizophagus clarus]GES88888.1 hypothetical protein GLOIN_2v1836991 [Rhizophagus clarus]